MVTPQQPITKSKKGKTELIHVPVSNADSCCYLGVQLDKHLTLHDHMQKIYTKRLSRVKLLKRIRHNISPSVAYTIYKVMIEPISTYRFTLYLGLPSTHIRKLDAVRKKAMSLIDNRSPPISVEIYKSYEKHR